MSFLWFAMFQPAVHLLCVNRRHLKITAVAIRHCAQMIQRSKSSWGKISPKHVKQFRDEWMPTTCPGAGSGKIDICVFSFTALSATLVVAFMP